SIMLVFKTFTSEDLVPILFQIICLYGSLFILIFLEIMMKANRREAIK
ncbi:TPA: NADH-quinone oxidoreductase subunit E, partial [Bacillus cereus]|nr:NADH-quinone oxidoreductase subunit E [Bacillus cereus]